LSETPTIVFGADVTHPGPGTRVNAPSVAAVVASVDDCGFNYRPSLRIQTGKKEMITELCEMVKERLIDYTEYTKKKPRRIIFCRDGVSEGQFEQVLNKELPAIVDACETFYTKKEGLPTITFLVVQKRHQTRFYPTDEKSLDNSGNILPGLVVENGVTSPSDFDFFLQSHAGLQGTSRPCYYHVLYDENKLSPNTLQKFLYDLCYVFERCTRSVSLIPPVYYADMMCTRGRAYIHKWYSEGIESKFKGIHADVLRGMPFM